MKVSQDNVTTHKAETVFRQNDSHWQSGLTLDFYEAFYLSPSDNETC